MRHPATCANEAPLRRRSYTLVELLLVIAIITMLIGLSVSALFQFVTGQHEKNTKFMMTQLNGALNKHWTAVAQTAAKENWSTPDNANALPLIKQWAGNDDNRARVMYVKFRLKQEFPTTFDEALNPYPLPPKPTYKAYLAKLGITGSSPATAPYESSVCLYMALTLSTGGTQFKADQLGLAVREFDAPSGKIKGFTDDWNNPLVFARWPWGDPNLQNLAPTVLNTPPAGPVSAMLDKDDPDGRLVDANWQANYPQGLAAFQQYAHPVVNPANGFAYYLIPVLVSAGRDNNLGINGGDFATLKVSNPSAAGDNIYSYNLGRN